jgi:hypothetical protein
MVYGSDWQTYGSSPCPRCGAAHGAAWQIPETQRSRFRLMQLVAEMGTRSTRNARNISAGVGQKFMLGLLIAGGTTFVATSGGNLGNATFVAAANAKGYTICTARRYNIGNNFSVVNRAISPGQYMSMQAPNASPAGDCAAPRLLQQAFQTLPAPHQPNNWEMSEVFYQPNTSRRTSDNNYWIHGLSAHSCATCANLVPLLLCSAP